MDGDEEDSEDMPDEKESSEARVLVGLSCIGFWSLDDVVDVVPGLVIRLPNALRASFDLGVLRKSLSPNAIIAGNSPWEILKEMLKETLKEMLWEERKALRLM